MARFDVYVNSVEDGWLLDIQSDIIPDIGSRIVVPLSTMPHGLTPVRFLNPTFVVNGLELVMLTHLVFAAPSNILARPIFNLIERQDQINRAIDVALYGF